MRPAQSGERSVPEVGLKQRERRAWSIVLLWTIGIFLAIPLARTVEGFVRDHIGNVFFGWFVISVVAVATAFALRSVLARGRVADNSQRSGLFWLLGVGAVFIAATAFLWRNPEEAVHFVQYGALAVLLYRALGYRFGDPSIYVIGGLLGTSVGCLDEALQWATPERYFGLRDIVINGLASVLVQIAIAKGIRPVSVSRSFSPAGIRGICGAASMLLSLLLLITINTPERTARWASAIPGLEFLEHNESTMMEYGFRYEVEGIGVFRSRFRLDELAAIDAARGEVAGQKIESCLSEYREFILATPPSRDAFLHELCVHLFRRDRYQYLSAHPDTDEGPAGLERRKLATVAVREERLVRKFFTKASAASGVQYAPGEFEFLEAMELPDLKYESTVSSDLVTEVREWQLLCGFGLGFVAIAALAFSTRR